MLNRIKHAIRWRLTHFWYTHMLRRVRPFQVAWFGFITAHRRVRRGRKHALPGMFIVSLTSFPPRFATLPLTLKCLLNQSVRPDKIVLWVAEHEMALVTPELRDMEDIDIRPCVDSGPYNKIIPALEQFPDAFIVTGDDDIYYKRRWLEILLDAWDGDLKTIVGHRVHRIRLDDKGLPLPYTQWRPATPGADSPLHFATGVGGVLYPPRVLDERVLNRDDFMSLCAKADDIWLFWMARLNGARIIKAMSNINDFVNWRGSQKVALYRQNVFQSKNDEKIKLMIDAYGWPV